MSAGRHSVRRPRGAERSETESWIPWRRWRARRDRQERELDVELQTHLDLEAAEQREAGLRPDDARAAARRAFGSVAVVEQQVRDAWGWTMMEQFLQDVRYALRTMRRSPGFTLTAVLSLAIGIGVNTGIFSLADALLFRPLAIRDPQAVVTVRSTSPDAGPGGVSFPDFDDLRARSQSFDGLVAHRLSLLAIATTPGAVPQMRMGMKVSRDFFHMLGVEPALGRAFLPEEAETPGRDAVVVLSHAYWLSELGGDPGVIGRTLQVSQVAATIVGVAPERFTGMDPIIQPYLYVPLSLGERSGEVTDSLTQRDQRDFIVRGRLRDGVTPERAQAELAGMARELEQRYPDTNRQRGVAVQTEMQLRHAQAPALLPVVMLLLGLAALVLAIVCANVSNLFMARARSRAREIAIRLAIGSGQMRLVRQLLTESVVLACVGCLAGLALGFGVIRYLRAIRLPTDTPMVIAVQMDGRVLAFSLALAVVSALAFGLLPALQAGRTNLVTALKRGETAAPARPRRLLGRQVLVVGQIALSLVLLTTAGIMIDAFREMLVVDPGFRTNRIAMMELDPGLIGYPADRAREFYRQLLERTRALPWVRAASLARAVPFRPNFSEALVIPEGVELPPGRRGMSTSTNTIDEDYFETMGIGLVRGRGFTSDDRETSRRVAVVNETFVATYWPGQEALGRRLRLSVDGRWLEVVGVARTTRYVNLAESPQAHIYLPLVQHPVSRLTLLVDTAGDPRAATNPLRGIVGALDARMPIFNVRTLRAMYEDGAIGTQRLVLQIVSAMGLLGLGLAVIGLYAMVAYSVSRRMREFGVRMSIGATRADIVSLVLREGGRMAAAGVAIGVLLSVPLQHAIRSALVGLGPLSPWTLVIVPLGLILVTLAACVAPAWRAAQVDPTGVLRLE